MKNETSVIKIKGIKKSFYGVPVVKGIDLKFYKGECIGLTGENGAENRKFPQPRYQLEHNGRGSLSGGYLLHDFPGDLRYQLLIQFHFLFCTTGIAGGILFTKTKRGCLKTMKTSKRGNPLPI